MIECIPNVSEGRRPPVVDGFAAAVRGVAGARLLDVTSDVSHNRSVLTMAGEAGAMRDAVLALFAAALPAIDLRTHQGVHPRLGAVDVVPFVPLEGSTMAGCVALAKEVGALVASRFDLPVFLYEEASANPARRNLEDIRRGQFEGLAAKLAQPGWAPDFGPSRPHPTAGATVIGARMPLIAYNVNLATDRLDVAKAIAVAVRASSGGLPCVKAMGVRLADLGIVQVSMNLTNYLVTPVRVAFDAVQREAAARGVDVLESELIGLMPAAALAAGDAETIQLRDISPKQILENRLRAAAEHT